MSSANSVGQWLSVSQQDSVGSGLADPQHVLSPRAPDEEMAAGVGGGGLIMHAAAVPASRAVAALPADRPSQRRWRPRQRSRRGGALRRRRGRPVPRHALLAAGHPLAPDNTTDFLMDDHDDNAPTSAAGGAADVVFDRYGWPTPVHSATPPPSLDGHAGETDDDASRCHQAVTAGYDGHQWQHYWSPQHDTPPAPFVQRQSERVASLVAQHLAMERSVEQLEERLCVLRGQQRRRRRQRRRRPDNGHASSEMSEDDEDEDDDEEAVGEVRMSRHTAAKIRLLQAEIGRLEKENAKLVRGNEVLASRVHRPLVSDNSEGQGDSGSGSADSDVSSSTSTSSSGSSTSGSSGSSTCSSSSDSSSSSSSVSFRSRGTGNESLDEPALIDAQECLAAAAGGGVARWSAPCSPHVERVSTAHAHRRLRRSASV